MPNLSCPTLSAAQHAALSKLRPLARAQSPAIVPPGHSVLALQPRAESSREAELWIYGPIGEFWWDDTSVSANDVVAKLKDLRVDVITVRINSYGGSVSDGIAIYNELRRHADSFGTQIVVELGSIAASIASLIAAAGDIVRMPANALQMLHAPWGYLYVEGNATEMLSAAEDLAAALTAFGKAMAPSYARKSGKPVSYYQEIWDSGKDRWLTAEECLAEGLIDEITGAAQTDDVELLAAFRPLCARPDAPVHQIQAALRGPQQPPVFAPLSNPAAGAAAPSPSTQGTTDMPNAIQPATTPESNADVAAQAAASVRAALSTRNAEILAMTEPHRGNPEVMAIVNAALANPDETVTAQSVGSDVLRVLGAQVEPLGGFQRVEAGADSRERRIQGMTLALQARAGVNVDIAGNQFRGLSLREMARACAEAAGVDTRGMAPSQFIQAAITHTSSDFPAIAGNTVRSAVLRGYADRPESFTSFTSAVTVPDFKATSLAGLGTFTGITEVPEGGEYPHGTFSSQGAEIKIAKRGGIFSITEEAIINDDLGLFDRVPYRMGAAAKRSLGDEVFSILTKNANLADGQPLFHASHGNLAAGAALLSASLDAMFASMAKVTDSDGELLGLSGRVLVVPVGLGGTARAILESTTEIVAGKNATAPNIMRNRFVVVEDARLDIADPKAWYVIADPALVDTIVVAYRDGVQEPTVSMKQGWNVEGIEFKVRLDAKPGLVDYRGLRKNPGV